MTATLGPVYDCGAADCWQCQRAFGPDRRAAIARYELRLAAYAASAAVPATKTPRALGADTGSAASAQPARTAVS